ncbi:MAG: type II toxin-antitoxin system RelE/ParE family toxin [Gammaproteobacteria bacterium]|nr:type II toxin-antitoxin system RelE/ParE family toxin [Gammaproteobacteria bacterium]
MSRTIRSRKNFWVMRIEWSYQARSDLRALRAYIAKDSPVNARRFVDRIIAGVDRLADFPDMGRLVPEAGARHDLR